MTVTWGGRVIQTVIGDVGPWDQNHVEISQHLATQLGFVNVSPIRGEEHQITAVYQRDPPR